MSPGMTDIERGKVRKGVLVVALLTGVGGVALVAGLQPGRADARTTDSALRVALARRLPKTKITSVDCSKLTGLCEVSAGNTLFYTDAHARYLVIGRIYDMETRTDLTAARLLELNPDTLLAGAPRNEDAEEGQGARPQRAAIRTVPLAELPKAGAITWGPVSGQKVVIFTDFRCGYCQRLTSALQSIGARVEERPISVLGTRALTEKVYCAKNPVAALHAAYAHDEPAAPARACDTSGLDANEAFAKRHAFTGTPVVVRADGQVIEGFRPGPELAAWLKSGPQA